MSDDPLADHLEHSGHADHDGGCKCAEVSETVADARVGECLDASVASGNANEKESELDDILEDVREGEVVQNGVVVAEMVVAKLMLVLCMVDCCGRGSDGRASRGEGLSDEDSG